MHSSVVHHCKCSPLLCVVHSHKKVLSKRKITCNNARKTSKLLPTELSMHCYSPYHSYKSPTLSMRSSSPLLKLLSSLAVFRSTVPLVSVAVASNGHEYTATLASSIARSTVPAGIRTTFQDIKMLSGHLFRTQS